MDFILDHSENPVFNRYTPSTVFHAAAHKHVPLMEENVVEAITNNILGTANLVEACAAGAVQTLVFISTDKAVRPTSVMGCTKRVAEQIVRAAAQATGRNFLSVRFGNVLASRGSVIPTFLRQIEAGGPVKIIDLARDLIRLSGLEEGVDVDITYSGVRPGEKLYEEVFFGHEAVEPTTHPKVLRSPADAVSDAKAGLIETLIQTALNEPDNWVSLRVRLRALVPDFHVPPPPPAVDDAETRPSGEQRKLRLA